MTVFVPLAWIANLDDSNSVVLTKLPIAIPWRNQLSLVSFQQEFVARSGNTKDVRETEELLFHNEHNWEFGETVTGPFRSGTGSQEAWCMDATARGADRSAVLCWVLGGKWSAFFTGATKDKTDFFTIIGKLE